MTDHSNTPIPMIDSAPTEPHENKGSTGSVIAILLIVSLLVIGAFYVWGQRVSEQRATQYIRAVQ
jgi:uncharacterized protein HemX